MCSHCDSYCIYNSVIIAFTIHDNDYRICKFLNNHRVDQVIHYQNNHKLVSDNFVIIMNKFYIDEFI